MALISFNTFVHDFLGAGPLFKFAMQLILCEFYLNAGVYGPAFSVLYIAENALGFIDACFPLGAGREEICSQYDFFFREGFDAEMTIYPDVREMLF